MDWQIIHRSLLRSIFETFTIFSLKYLKNKLDLLFKNPQLIEGNFSEFEAIVNFANCVPFLYKEGIIVEINMNLIDFIKFITFIQKLAGTNDMFLRIYITTIAKWSDLLILSKIKI